MNLITVIGIYFIIFLQTIEYNKIDPPITSGADQSVSIMSFNIRYDNWDDGENKWDNRKESCIRMIEEKAPSVIGIQEGLESQVDYLGKNLTSYSRVGVGRDDGKTGGEYCAVFYLKQQYKLLDDDTFWLSETPDVPSYGWDAVCRRIVTWVRLQEKESDKIFYVFNTHFDHKGKDAREKSALLLIEKINEIADSNTVVFITGDFNALISNSILDPILEEFHQSRSTAAQSDNDITFNGWGKSVGTMIDFIFYRQANAEKFETINGDFGVPYISDHYPIMAQFKY